LRRSPVAPNSLWVSGVRDTGKRAKVALKTFFGSSNNSCAYKLPTESHSRSHKANKQIGKSESERSGWKSQGKTANREKLLKQPPNAGDAKSQGWIQITL